ncbi:MAG: quinone-dependent dihydroorotate dehydrogenase [Pseudomonadales bacterium]|nr:quinone-dependent dihydroorotate dehydrogenase [Pseudomonadales bacterium]
MYNLLKQILFHLPAEASHGLALRSMDMAYRLGVLNALAVPPQQRSFPCTVMGIEFPNPVGLAAGLDKNADHIEALAALGFGFVEVGTLTPRPQSGNPKPRLFRLKTEQAIINRMGFNNKGIDHALARIQASRFKGVLGINIGKNRDTPVARAAEDYLVCLRKAYPFASYIVINLSSPNTPGLRALQFGEELPQLLGLLKSEQHRLRAEHGKHVPLLVKIAPDLDNEEIALIAEVLVQHGIEGVIATNTTLDRTAVLGSVHCNEAGGLSGAPLTARSTAVLRHLVACLAGRLPVIAVGGIMTAADAAEKFAAGAALVQLYSGFIYSGPRLIAECIQVARHELTGPAVSAREQRQDA